ncbi:phosphoribosylformylglycinamidine cyclo-ligase [Lyngbya confervoides]|uniref:Phosphoribosylformylglycinamidine cyclo-ligase n=1 Tax=Lyngbya confervoides BDU141951 TaxID=1574623 RepID=A0ABD4T1Z3_9CYAN|nr:phosphoribosylformylglycinamidine cyclo-ligase [Lyngbya confervoides]MCM1982698.1 phosphoribosylformylglycinamidine cyclo-ligase [Lyngbya confervoides BDU141951]
MDYKEAGVNLEAGREFVRSIQLTVQQTYRPGVLGGLGGFGGAFEIPAGYRHPVLISGTDGVGTKLKLAHALHQHHTVGIDLVAMCVNDILTSGAEPLFFLDYLATGILDPKDLQAVVSGIAQGCIQAGCALLGGETAEMPGFYQPQEYDLAGFCVGIVERDRLLDRTQVQIGDIAIGLASHGVHSNGFSLVRKVVETQQLSWGDRPEDLGGPTLGEILLEPTAIYVQAIQAAFKAGMNIHGMAHITGGGLPENLPRCHGEGQSIELDSTSWPRLPIFEWIAQQGSITEANMFDTFNMGIGYVVLVPPEQATAARDFFHDHTRGAYIIGQVVNGDGRLKGIPLVES